MTLPSSHADNLRLHLIYATVSGTARQVAEAVQMQASDLEGVEVAISDMNDVDTATTFDPQGPLLLLCVATTGSGDVPDDAKMLYESLVSAPRYLGGLKYGLIALGDSSYGSTFCRGGMHFENALQDLGASRIGEILRLDAMEEPEPEQAAIRWFEEWKKTARLTQ